jgi:hypothetical protein
VVELSIIELGIYGFITYVSILMLIISTIKEVKETQYSALVRSIFFIPGIITCGILIMASPDISLDTVHTLTITNDTINTVFYEDTVTTDKITLLNPVWGLVHFVFLIVLILYVFKQMLLMLGVGKTI